MKRSVSIVMLATTIVAAACASRPAPAPSLAGAWRSSVQFSSGVFAGIQDLEFMYVFNEGGTLTESSNYDAAPPVPPAYGVWRSTGPGEFEARYEFFVTSSPKPDTVGPEGWLPSGRGVLVERITLSADSDTFTSSIRYEAFDANGQRIEGGGEARGRGLRIKF